MAMIGYNLAFADGQTAFITSAAKKFIFRSDAWFNRVSGS